jgi:hypothetical protein
MRSLFLPRRGALLTGVLLLGALTFVGCDDDDDDSPMNPDATPTMFRVEITNVSGGFDFPVSGSFAVPMGGTEPGAIGPGGAYEFEVGALPGQRLSFATMFVQSNDLFYAPDGDGIPLFDAGDNPISGDVTAMVSLWDAGTELNETPGEGVNQAPRQGDANTGAVDIDTTVRPVNDAFTYHAVSDVIQVTVTSLGDNRFRVRIENVSTAATLATSTGSVAVPMAPGVFVVHDGSDPLFVAGSADSGDGLEGVAEDGANSTLADALASRTGVSTPFAPGVFAVHDPAVSLFVVGSPDAGLGLEAIAEDGNPADLDAALTGLADVSMNGVFNTPEGAGGPGPIVDGWTYAFTVTARPGERLSFATMFVQSNDLIVAPSGGGLDLFPGGTALSGNATASLAMYDVGTEMNQWPGVGPDQAPRQTAPDTGAADADVTIRLVDDGFAYPAVARVIELTVTPQ